MNSGQLKIRLTFLRGAPRRAYIKLEGGCQMLRAIFLISLLLLSCSGQNAAAYQPRSENQTAAASRFDHEKGLSTAEYTRLIDRISESGGYFDTDNLISNERSYLHVLGKMRKLGLSGGAYIGVGPDQNFSYIAQLRPSIAFIVDIRRDNMLQHLFFKALFSTSSNRGEYLCQLVGRAPVAKMEAMTISQIVETIDKTPGDAKYYGMVRQKVLATVKTFGLKLDEKDLSTIGKIHDQFFAAGLDLKFTSHNRSARPYYPNFRDLLLEKDLTGKQVNYLVTESDYQFVRQMSNKNLIVPVVGNLAGDKAVAEIGKVLKESGEKLSAFYTSNVEYYLMGDGIFGKFAENLKKVPMDSRTLIIRSIFGGGFGGNLRQALPGYYSVQQLQPAEAITKGNLDSYYQLVSKDTIELN